MGGTQAWAGLYLPSRRKVQVRTAETPHRRKKRPKQGNPMPDHSPASSHLFGRGSGTGSAGTRAPKQKRNAMSQAPDERPSIILVHGAWADGSRWRGVIARLHRQGWGVSAVQLPLISLPDRAFGPVVLVGHSCGDTILVTRNAAARRRRPGNPGRTSPADAPPARRSAEPLRVITDRPSFQACPTHHAGTPADPLNTSAQCWPRDARRSGKGSSMG